MSKFTKLFKGTSSHESAADDSIDPNLWTMKIGKYHRAKFSMATVRGNSVLQDYIQVDTSPGGLYFGVYDGHRGYHAAAHLAINLHKEILEGLKNNNNEMSENILTQAVSKIDYEFIKWVEHFYGGQQHLGKVGSCCLCGFIRDDTLYISNLGDSRAIIGYEDHNNELCVLPLTQDDKCNDEEIRNNLKLAHPNDPNIVLSVGGCYRVKGIMKVTQTVGDAYLKWLPFNSNSFPKFEEVPEPFDQAVLTSESHGLTRRILKKDKFLIVASHEFWEVMSNEEAVQIVNERKKEGIAKHLLETVLEKLAERKGYNYQDLLKAHEGLENRRDWHDDITVLVIYLNSKRMHLLGKKKVEVFCHRCRFEGLTNVSDFGKPEFKDLL